MEQKQSRRRQILTGAAMLAALVCVLVLSFTRIGRPMLRLVSEPEFFREWVEARGIVGRLAYIGMVFIQVLLALIPGEPLEIAGGYAFGALEGTLLCLGAATLGSVLVFLLVRRFGMKLVCIFFPKEKLRSLRFLQISKKRSILFLIVFILPGTPKDLLCYFAGLTDIKFGLWLLICSLGRLPSIVTSTIGGDALGSGSYIFAVIVFVATLAISAAGVLIYHRIESSHRERKKAPLQGMAD